MTDSARHPHYRIDLLPQNIGEPMLVLCGVCDELKIAFNK